MTFSPEGLRNLRKAAMTRTVPGIVLNRLRTLAFGLLALTLASGCGLEEAKESPAYLVRDSAGIEIVESRRAAWETGEGWRVGAEAIVRIGMVEGDPAYQFSGITGGARLTSGGVVVADGGSQEVRFFDSDGTILKTVGRPGGGPGEFTGLSGLGKDGAGSLWVYDFSLRRVTWVDGSGEITGLTSLGMEPAMLNPVGPLPDKTFALKQLWGAREVSEASNSGLRRDPVAVVRFNEVGSLVDTVGLFPGREIYLFDEGGRGVMATPPFARNAVATIRAGNLVVGDQESFELGEYRPSGELLRLLRVKKEERLVGPEEMESFLQGRLTGAPPEEHASIRRSIEEMPRPETMPAYGGILGDEAGNLWVAEWTMPGDYPSSWWVFDRNGIWLGQVVMPARFWPMEIGPDWVLGFELDHLDVEFLVLYPLGKG